MGIISTMFLVYCFLFLDPEKKSLNILPFVETNLPIIDFIFAENNKLRTKNYLSPSP